MSEIRVLDEFRTQALHCIEDAYIKGYEAARQDIVADANKSEYERGLNDAWECASKIYNFSGKELSEVFPKSEEIPFYSYSASEAIAAIKEYEDRQKKADDEIHVGDEVYCLDKNHKSIVVGFTNKNLSRCLVMSEQGFLAMDTDTLHKTGRTYPVKEMFEKLNESEE